MTNRQRFQLRVPDSQSVARNMSTRASGSNSSFRSQRYTNAGGYYQGRWLHGQHHGYGIKATGRGLIYEGQWLGGQRHGYGTLRRLGPNGHAQRIYVGQWSADVRCGEGKQDYENGDVYYGQWLGNVRHGRGIQWQPDGSIYVGEWLKDAMHGRGALCSANGNRYVGEFANGCKSGRGIYYHQQEEGQSVPQHGLWSDNMCRASLLPIKSAKRNL
ncbi:MORN repeat-containing protein 3 [Drosophila novamexicana]|uniref:MORN repeat-containing protein 3 n=1 Tax=Drosophila novamexicana TaxID=47314 RepID=UPI0011E5D721|nr:MORN repeat-containing protein 3 [Drosophila novamexicana]